MHTNVIRDDDAKGVYTGRVETFGTDQLDGCATTSKEDYNCFACVERTCLAHCVTDLVRIAARPTTPTAAS